MKRAAGAHEVLDGELSPTDLAATLGDIDRLNAWFGGHALICGRSDALHAKSEQRIANREVLRKWGLPLFLRLVGSGRANLALHVNDRKNCRGQIQESEAKGAGPFTAAGL